MPIYDDAEVAIVPLSQITFGDRRRLDYGNLNELSQSIKEKGLISSLTLKRLSSDSYLLLAGGRRFKACEQLGLESVPARIYSRDLTEIEIRGIELAENIDRKQLSFAEEARLCKEIDDLYRSIHGEKIAGGTGNESGWRQEDTANLMGFKKDKISKEIKIAKAIEMFPELANCKDKAEVLKRMSNLGNSIIREEVSKKLIEKASLTPADKIKTDLVNSYIIGDFFTHIKNIPDESVDFAEIDTPYGIDLTKNKASADNNAMQTDGYNEWPYDQFTINIDEVLSQVYRVLKKDAWMVFWFAPEPWFESIYTLIIKNNFACRRMPGIWEKKGEDTAGNAQTLHPDIYLGNGYELFFYARKGNAILNKQGRSNIFTYKPVNPLSKIHPTERPVEMIQEICEVFCPPGGSVITPFAGSGNTILAANNTYRKAFGYDLNKEYKDSFIIRVFEGIPYKYRSYKEII